ILLQSGADANIQDYHGYTPLHIAARCGSTPNVKALLQSGANPHIHDDGGRTALHAATQKEDCVDTVSVLLDAGADVNAKDHSSGRTPLHYASQRCLPSVTQLLLKFGANPDARDWIYHTALHGAMQRADCAQTIPALLEAGADADARDKGGKTPL
ncbi:hypothetical protein BOTBODRAFT_82704, partial [Botryobasidium botryosum FD-172 SS1]